MNTLENVSIQTRANVYFEGKCVSHSLTTADGQKKSVGVILPSSLTFNTAAPEVMQIVAGQCRVRLPGADWQAIEAGSSFNVPGDAQFDIEVSEAVHYICHFG